MSGKRIGWVAALALCAAGCGDDDSGPRDGTNETTPGDDGGGEFAADGDAPPPDASDDSADLPDPGPDAGPDVMPDAGPDAADVEPEGLSDATDAGPEGTPDAADVPVDTVEDEESADEAAADDGGPPPLPVPPERLYVLFYEPSAAASAGRWGALRLAARDVAATAWNVETLATGLYDSAYYTYGSLELAVDSAGRPHVAYMAFADRELRYTRWNGSAWVRADGTPGYDVLDTNVFTYNARHFLALRADVPHLVYRQETNLKYYRWTTGGWVDTVALPLYPATGEPNPGGGPALALDAAGRPHVAHHDHHEYHLHYAAFDGTSWSNVMIPGLPGMVGEYKNIALDALGRPHIAFQLGYTRWNGTTWTAADGTPGYDAFDASFISAGFGPDGTVLLGAHVSGSLVLYRRPIDGGDWDAGTRVDADASMVDFAGDQVGGAHVVLVRSSTGTAPVVRYLHEAPDGTWPAETVYTGSAGGQLVHPTLAVWP